MKLLQHPIKLFLFLILLLLLAVFAFVATFDANNYKPQIIEQVKNATGRDFAIDGDINLSVFPWVGLKVEGVTLGNEEGFSAKQFAAIRQLDVKVNVLPLLKKQVEINTIRLHGLDVSLQVASDKSNNWSGLTQAGDESDADGAGAEVTPATESGKAATAEADKALPLQSLKVEGFELVDAIVRYDDRSSDTSATISELNLTSSAIEFNVPVQLEFGARVENNQPAIDTRLKLTTQLTFDQEFSKLTLRDFVFTVLAQANEFIPQEEAIEISSEIDVLMQEQRVTLKQLQLTALGATTVADVTVSKFQESPVVHGVMEVQSFDARDVAKRAGVELPLMANADALSKVAIKTKLEFQGQQFQADDFILQLDGSTLTGWLHVVDINKQQLRYDLAFDHLNINDYLPPVEQDGDAEQAAAASVGDTAANKAGGDEKIELPVEMLRQLDIQGDFRIASLVAKDFDIKQFSMALKAQNGVIAVKPVILEMLEGRLESALDINVQKTLPAYAISLDADQIQAGPVANPYLASAMGEKPLKMNGAIDLKMGIKTSGETVNQLKKASKGQIVLEMKQTEVDGFDPEYYMRKSVADYVQAKGFSLSDSISGSYKPREVTVFDKIYSTVKLADGKASTDDFLMDSKRVQVRADGYADIMHDRLDVMSSVRLPRGKTAAEKIFDEPVYVRVHGPYTALEYDIDEDRLKKSTTDVLKNQAKAKLDEEKQRLKEKADEEVKRAEEKAKEKLEDTLKDKLKGLF